MTLYGTSSTGLRHFDPGHLLREMAAVVLCVTGAVALLSVAMAVRYLAFPRVPAGQELARRLLDMLT